MMNIKKQLREGLNEYGYDEEGYDDEYDGEEYFQTTIDPQSKKLSNRYRGRGVMWYGIPGQMAVIHKSNIHGMWGNIYDNKKLKYMENLILRHEDYVEIECSYGIADAVSFAEIVEHQQAHYNESFYIDYDGYDEPYSIGDDALDEYLGSDDLASSDHFFKVGWADDSDVTALIEQYRTDIATGFTNKEEFLVEFNDLDIEPSERDLAAVEEFLEIEEMLGEAIRNEEGDLGDLSVQLRDGHHRVFGAIAAGEQYVCVNITEEGIEKYGHLIQLVKTK